MPPTALLLRTLGTIVDTESEIVCLFAECEVKGSSRKYPKIRYGKIKT